MPGFADLMRQRFGGGRLPLDPAMSGGGGGEMMQPPPQGMMPPPQFSGEQYGMPPMNSGIVRPGQFGGGGGPIMQGPDDMSIVGGAAPLNPMPSLDQRAVPRKMGGRNRMQSMQNPAGGKLGGRKLGQGGEPVF